VNGIGQARPPWLPILGTALCALVLFGRTLGGGFLSDDFLLPVLGGIEGEGLRVDWAAVLADFGRPWLGFDLPFYRPMLSLSFAGDLALGGGAAWPFHLTNLLLHALVTATAAALGALLVPRRPAAAAWIAGLCVALHPVAAEPVAWIAARNSGLEVAFRSLAMLCFARHLRDGTGRTRIAALLLGAAAFATKESAVMLPVSLLAIDLLDRPRRPLGQRIRLQLPFALLVLGYLGLRVLVLGTPFGEGGGAAPGSIASRIGTKLAALLHGGSFATGPLLGFVLAAGLFRARLPLLVGSVWLLAHTLPTHALAMSEGLGGSRMVYGALPALGILVARVVVDGAPWLRVAPLLAVGTWAMLALPTWDRLDEYAKAWDAMDAAVAGLAALADRATPARPLAIAAMPPNAPGIPPCNPNAWFPLAERPHQEFDLPVVSLGFVTVPVPFAETLHGDASAIRAMAEHGSAIVTWQPGGGFLVRQRGEPIPLPTLEPDPAGPGAVRFGLPLPAADAIEALTIHVADGRPSGARLRWSTPGPALPDALAGLALGPGVPVEDGARIEVDLTHHLGPVSLATYGIPWTGLDVELDGPGRVERIDLHRRLPQLALDGQRLAGRRVGLDALEGLRAPEVDAAASLRLLLLGPHSAIPVACEPGAPVRIPAAVAREFEVFARIARQDRILFWFEARTAPGQPGFARSAVDWLELDSGGN
jgi:hypothetical protein